jgi:hypothetical protein
MLFPFHNRFHKVGGLVRLPRAWVALAVVGFTCVTSHGYSVTAAGARLAELGKEIPPSEVHTGYTTRAGDGRHFLSDGKVGWGGWTRTNTVLINSEVSYQLDHAPAVPRL